MKVDVFVYSSISLLSACCASLVMLSTSSRNIIRYGAPIGFSLQKFFMFVLTVSIPLASDAFSSRKFCLQFSLSIDLVSASAVVVFPTPAGPENIRLGMFSLSMYCFSLGMTCSWPTMSSSVCGLYFSTHGPFIFFYSFLFSINLCFYKIIFCNLMIFFI